MDRIPLKTIFQVIGAGFTGQMHFLSPALNGKNLVELECGPMPNLMVALPNIGGALC